MSKEKILTIAVSIAAVGTIAYFTILAPDQEVGTSTQNQNVNLEDIVAEEEVNRGSDYVLVYDPVQKEYKKLKLSVLTFKDEEESDAEEGEDIEEENTDSPTPTTKLSNIGDTVTPEELADLSTSDLTDVSDNIPAEGQVLVWDAGTNQWKPATLNIPEGGTIDEQAVHVDEAGEIAALTEKGTPAGTDFILIEDSEDNNTKKKIQISNLPTGSSVSVIDDLGDVDTSSSAPTDGQVLVWDLVNSEWVPGDLPASGATSANELLDVDTATIPPTAGQVLVWDDGAYEWVPGDLPSAGASAIDDLSDVDTSSVSPTDGQSLVWNNSTGEWEPQTIVSDTGVDTNAIHDNVSGEISSLAEKATPVAGDLILIEDSENSNTKKYVQVGSLPTGATSADELSDVDTSSVAPTDGQALVWDNVGAKWIPGDLPSGGASAIDDLSDVDTTSSAPTDGQSLVWNDANSAWEPATIVSDTGVDTSAIHDNVSGEISVITEKATPVAGDFLLIEDSEASNAKKRIQLGNLPTGLDVEESDVSPSVSDINKLIFPADSVTDNADGSVSISFPGSGGGMAVSELDGAPSVAGVNEIKFDGATVTDNGDDTVTVSISGAGSSSGTDIGALVQKIGSSQSISNASTTTVTWDTEVYDTDDMVDLGSSNTRITAQRAGTYLVYGAAEFSGNTNGARIIWFTGASGRQTLGNGALVPGRMSLTSVVKMDVGDYVELIGYQDSGTTLTIENKSYSTFLGLQLLQPAISSVDDLADIDTTSTPPSDGQTLVWDSSSSKWIPGDMNSSSSDVSVMVENTVVQTMVDNVATTLTFNNELYDTSNMWDAGNPTRLVIPTTGKYLVKVGIYQEANAGTNRIGVKKNGTDVVLYQELVQIGFQSPAVTTTYLDFEAGDYIEAYYYHNSSGDIDLNPNDFFATQFGAVLLGGGAVSGAINDLSDVDTTSSAPTAGQALVWDEVGSKWVPGDVSSGGSAPVYSKWDADAPPETPHAYDDEFDDDTIDPSWIQSGTGISEANGFANLSNSKIIRSVPSGNFTVWTKVSWTSQYQNYHSTFFALSNSTTWNGGTAYALVPASYANDSARMEVQRLVNGSWNATVYEKTPYWMHTSIYMKWQHIDGTVYGSVSLDGISWRRIYSVAMTPQTMYLHDSSWGSRIEFVRFSDTIANDALLPGRMIDVGGGGSSGGASMIDELTDVDTSSVAPTDGQSLVWDDAASQWEPGTVSGVDTSAIHDNVSGEISLIAEKATPVNADLLVIEDSADSNNKKKIQIGSLPFATAINELSDVDTATLAPTSGQALIWDDVNSKWVPGDIASSIPLTVTAPYSSDGGNTTKITASSASGVVTVLYTRTESNLPAGKYLISGTTYVNNTGNGALGLKVGTTYVDYQGTHTDSGYRKLIGVYEHTGGDLVVQLIHIGEGSSITYLYASGDSRWSNKITIAGLEQAIEGNGVSANIGDGARIYNNSDISILNGASTILTFNSEHWDDASFHDTSSNTEYFVIPEDGRYSVGCTIEWQNNTSGRRFAQIDYSTDSGSTWHAVGTEDSGRGPGGESIQTFSSIWNFSAGDMVRLRVYQSSGTTLNIVYNDTRSPSFWIQREK